MTGEFPKPAPPVSYLNAKEAVRRLRLHAAAHLDVARADGEAERAKGAQALLDDANLLDLVIESMYPLEEGKPKR